MIQPGDELKPNTTMLPNLVLDSLMPQLTGSEEKVIRVICRQTYGWHKKSDRISNSQMQKKCGIDEGAMKRAVKKLADRKIIIRHMGNGRTMTEYSINYNVSEWEGVILAPPELDTPEGVKLEGSGGGKTDHNKTNKQNKLSKEKDGAFSMLPQRLSGNGKNVSRGTKPKDDQAYADFETFCTFWESMTGQDYRKQKPGYYFGARKKYGVETLHAALKGYAGSEWHKEKRAWNLGKFFRDDVYKYMPKKEQDASVWDWAKLPGELSAYKELLQVGDRFGGTWYLTTAENLTASFVEDQFKKHGVSVKITKKAGI